MHDKNKAVRMAIAAAGISNSELAQRMGVSRAYIHRITKTGTPISEKQVKRVASACGLHLKEVLAWGWSDEQ